MGEMKDKVITLEDAKYIHDHDEATYAKNDDLLDKLDKTGESVDVFGLVAKKTMDGISLKIDGFAESESKVLTGKIEIIEPNTGDLENTGNLCTKNWASSSGIPNDQYVIVRQELENNPGEYSYFRYSMLGFSGPSFVDYTKYFYYFNNNDELCCKIYKTDYSNSTVPRTFSYVSYDTINKQGYAKTDLSIYDSKKSPVYQLNKWPIVSSFGCYVFGSLDDINNFIQNGDTTGLYAIPEGAEAGDGYQTIAVSSDGIDIDGKSKEVDIVGTGINLNSKSDIALTVPDGSKLTLNGQEITVGASCTVYVRPDYEGGYDNVGTDFATFLQSCKCVMFHLWDSNSDLRLNTPPILIGDDVDESYLIRSYSDGKLYFVYFDAYGYLDIRKYNPEDTYTYTAEFEISSDGDITNNNMIGEYSELTVTAYKLF